MAAVVVVVLVACLCAAAMAYTGDVGYDMATVDHPALGEEVYGEDDSGGMLRRALAARQPTNRYISYAALRADQVPCNKRGQSYYNNCASQKAANPYRRGCSAITRCSRNTN
ncbi:hypothetical protein GUJ93_ZPchr0005g14496 [Zizania palustris]|uniref:Uncharacterized protein n=1 Tax=Zizania palustris TaxID=103762 RepID=A0A8J5SRE7_ZIZPA|nr:hypothetical protein GUJ93_ZPchr0005g14496 [Zizania palustris]